MTFSSRRLRHIALIAVLCASAAWVCPLQASHVRRGPTAPQSHSHRSSKGHASKHSGKAVSARPRAIDDARATEIQGALVKAGYLQNASGHWDDASADAMRKMQADNGWQTKLIPDSRALIKLGLGADTGATAGSGAATSAGSGSGVTANSASPMEQ